MGNATTTWVTIGYTRMRNKLHLNLNDGYRPQCGQGTIVDPIAIEPVRTSLDRQRAFDTAVEAVHKAEPDAPWCQKCFSRKDA